MRYLKLAFILMFMATAMTGCGLFKKKNKYEFGSDTGFDTPLSEDYPLEDFQEPSGSDSLYFKDVRFEYNSYQIDWEGKNTLLSISEWLKENSTRHLLVEGHCDERGTNEYNLALGEQRALAVREFLVEQSVEANRVQTISYGEEKPLDPGHDEGAWSQNRRAHFLISRSDASSSSY